MAAYLDTLPEKERRKVIDALIAGGDEPDYRALVKRLGLKCTHATLWRYHVTKIKPALKRSLEAATVAQSAVTPTESDVCVSPQERAKAVTKQVLADDPIVSLWEAQRLRLESAIGETLNAKQFDTYARLESVAAKNYEGTAKTILHPGWTPQQNAGSGTTVQIAVLAPGTTVQIAAPETPQVALDIADIQQK